MTCYVEVWESQKDYEYFRNYNGVGDEPKEPKFVFAYDNFTWMEKYISNHPKFWEIHELLQLAAEACLILENEKWKGPHPDHNNLKVMKLQFLLLTKSPIINDFIGVCYINK